MKGDERSEAYAEISRKSFQPLIEEGVIEEIIPFEAITPSSPCFEEHVNRYNWSPSLMTMDTGDKDHSPTEKAGMCSHWELMRMAANSKERFWVIEHDTVLLEEHIDTFKMLVDYTVRNEILYSNIGLFMGMYSLDRITAEFMYNLLINYSFPINCGPYCTLQRLFRTYTTDVLSKQNYRNRIHTAIHPWKCCTKLGFGRHIGEYYNTYQQKVDSIFGDANSIPVPTTQVISKSMCVTQDHHSYKGTYQDQPWTRHEYFKVID